MVTEKDIETLNNLYNDRVVYHGEMRDHAKTGGTSDGKHTLEQWKGAMDALKVDFAAILDHRQVRHMYLPEFEDGLFICGTEPAALITDSNAKDKWIHYNLIVPSPKALEDILNEFSEYEFTGGSEWHFKYAEFSIKRLRQLIASLKARGGFFVHPHPALIMQSDNALDYWFSDETGFEIFYYNMDNEMTHKNYELWVDILSKGKRIFAIAGGDGHSCCSDGALTTIYAQERSSAGLLRFLRVGDFVCGAVGVRMCIGNQSMGGVCSFKDKRLIVSVGDFHKSVLFLDHDYRIDILDDKGVIFSSPVAVGKNYQPVVFKNGGIKSFDKITVDDCYFAIDANDDAKFYRVEIFDETRKLRIAIGNPIWNEKFLDNK
jgi:hypothetical protein